MAGLASARVSALGQKRLLALIVACALIACTAMYSAHGLGDRDHAHTHCDLCVHFSGSAGAPGHASVPGKPLLVVRVPPVPRETPRPTPSPVGFHLPRGPPLATQLI